MKTKRFLALAVALMMVLSIVPAMTVSAAEETVLFDIDNVPGSGEQTLNVAGWTAVESGAAARWNQNWGPEATGVWGGGTGTYALMFFFTNPRQGGDGNVTATIDSAANTNGATKVTLDFNFATQESENIYQTWTFLDVDGNEYARLAFDRNNTVRFGFNDTPAHDGSGTDAVYGFRGTNIKIETIKNATDYTINYYAAGSLKASETVANANGFSGIKSFHGTWNNQYSAAGLQDLVITYEVPETIKVVEAAYVANDEVVKTVTYSYDASVEDGVTFPAYGYSANGSNTMYYAPATTLAESATIEMTAVVNNGDLEIGHVFANAGAQYEIKSANLIPNGDFSLGLAGWYNGAGTAMTQLAVNNDGTAKLTGDGGSSSEAALQRSWKLEANKTYLFTYTQDNSNVGASGSARWQRLSLNNDFSNNNNAMLLGAGAGDVETGQSVVLGTNNLVFTNTDGFAYANFRAGYSKDVTVGNFGLYEIAEAEVTVTEEIESIETPAVKVFGNDEVVLPATLKVTGTLGSNVDGTVEWDAPDAYIAGANTVNGTLTVQFGDAEPITESVSIEVTVIDEFTLEDFTSVNDQTAGKNNQKVFPVAIRGAFTMQFTANYASFGDLFITMKTKDAGFFTPEQIALGVNGSKAFRPVDGNGSGGRANADADQASLTVGVDYGFIVTTDASKDKYSVVIYDVATSVVVAEVNDFGYRTNADAIEAITALTNNGQGSVTLTNIKVTAGTKAVTYYDVVVDGQAKKALKPLGLEMVPGAQVRIGKTNLAEGGKLDAMADSGIRFIATVDRDNTLAADADEIGIKVTAEASDKAAYVSAENFQDDADTVFTAAITNLAESNYNRKYTAVAYAKFGDVEITSDAVTRSIYQVSAGIMKNGGTAEADMEYTVDGVVKNILNAYVNQTGIRLTVKDDGITVEENKYTGDVFFTVECVSDGDDGWNVTITPDTSWGTPAEIAAWWTDYVRFNNNNSKAKEYISASHYVNSDPVYIHEDGTLTFNFDTTDDGTGGFDGPWVPILPTDK